MTPPLHPSPFVQMLSRGHHYPFQIHVTAKMYLNVCVDKLCRISYKKNYTFAKLSPASRYVVGKQLEHCPQSMLGIVCPFLSCYCEALAIKVM